MASPVAISSAFRSWHLVADGDFANYILNSDNLLEFIALVSRIPFAMSNEMLHPPIQNIWIMSQCVYVSSFHNVMIQKELQKISKTSSSVGQWMLLVHEFRSRPNALPL